MTTGFVMFEDPRQIGIRGWLAEHRTVRILLIGLVVFAVIFSGLAMIAPDEADALTTGYSWHSFTVFFNRGDTWWASKSPSGFASVIAPWIQPAWVGMAIAGAIWGIQVYIDWVYARGGCIKVTYNYGTRLLSFNHYYGGHCR